MPAQSETLAYAEDRYYRIRTRAHQNYRTVRYYAGVTTNRMTHGVKLLIWERVLRSHGEDSAAIHARQRYDALGLGDVSWQHSANMLAADIACAAGGMSHAPSAPRRTPTPRPAAPVTTGTAQPAENGTFLYTF